MLQWHTAGAWAHRAYWGENVIAWGKDGTPERLRIGDLPAVGQVGPARGARSRSSGLKPGHDDRRLGVHPARRHRLLGQGRDRDLDAAGGPALRLADGLGPGPQAPTAARGCPTAVKAIVGVDRAKRTEAQKKELLRLLRRARLREDAPGLRPAARAARPGRAGAQADRRPDPDDAGLPREGRRARSRRSCSIAASTTSGATRSAGRRRRSCRRCRRARRSTAWAWPGGWSRPTIR